MTPAQLEKVDKEQRENFPDDSFKEGDEFDLDQSNLASIDVDYNINPSREGERLQTKKVEELYQSCKKLKETFKALNEENSKKLQEEKDEQKENLKQGEWAMIKVIEKYLMIVAVIDFSAQIII